MVRPACSSARVPARRRAAVRPSASISSGVAVPTAQPAAQDLIGGTRRSRSAGVRSFESRMPGGGRAVERSITTSPTWTGPAGEPRPTSSMAPSRYDPDRRRRRSRRRVGTPTGRRPPPAPECRPTRLDGRAMPETYRRRTGFPRHHRSRLRTTLPRALRGSVSTTRTQAGLLVGGEQAVAVGPQRPSIDGRSAVGHHPGRHHLAPLVGRRPGDGHLGHPRATGQNVLDLGRVDVEPTRDDELGGPAPDHQVAVLVARRGRRWRTTGPPPSPRSRNASALAASALEVAVEDVGAAHQHLARVVEDAPPPRAAGNRPCPARRSPTYGLEVFMRVSVMP